MEKYYGWGLPINVSAHGAEIDRLIYIVHVLMFVLFIGWFTFLVTALVKFRKRPGHQATYKLNHFKTPTYAEVAVALAEIALLVGFSFPIGNHIKNIFPDAAKSMQVHIVAEQFAWNVHYPGPDGIFGKSDPHLINPTNPVGLDPNDAGGKDDIVAINQLHIPVNQPVIVRLSSKDVIHSFFLPVMRIKQDVIPGQTIPIWFEAKKAGNFEIACAQLCGLGHYRMRGFFIVQKPEDFKKWENEQLAGRFPVPALVPSPSPPAPAAGAVTTGTMK